jgi:CRP-like cAMP-binding protein
LVQTKLTFGSGIRNQHFEPGDVIFRQGDLGDSVYVVEEGECEVLCQRNGTQELLATLASGTYFGEMALLSDRTRSATLRARTAMEVLIIPKADFNKLRQSVPAFGNVFAELAARRAAARSPRLPADPSMLGSSPGMPTGASGGNSGQRVLF